MVQHCCVHGCNTDSRKQPGARFFKFPGQVKRAADRRLWLKNVNRMVEEQDSKGVWRKVPWQPKNYSVICYKHFFDGEPTEKHPAPELHMGHQYILPVKGRRVIEKHYIKTKVYRKRKRDTSPDKENTEIGQPQKVLLLAPAINSALIKCTENCIVGQAEVGKSAEPSPENHRKNGSQAPRYTIQMETTGRDHGFKDIGQQLKNTQLFHPYARPPAASKEEDKIIELQGEVKQLQDKLETAKDRLQNGSSRFSHKVIENDDKKTRKFTGFPTWRSFNTIFERYIKPKAKFLCANQKPGHTPWQKTSYKVKPGRQRKLDLKDEFLLVMMRIRLGSLMTDLGVRFDLHDSQVSRILSTWIPFLSRRLRKLIRFPTKDKIQQHMPKSFTEFNRTRVTIDCTEIFIERPTTLRARQQTWSTYKHHNTAKVLIGVTPSGGISFLSKAWGGRTSDKHMTTETGLLDNLDPYDDVMADRGFIISAELAERCCTLNIPPFTQGKPQLSSQEVDKHRKISKLRIHVERAIERIKNFKILQGVYPLDQIHHLDDILTICGAVVNLWPPIVTK